MRSTPFRYAFSLAAALAVALPATLDAESEARQRRFPDIVLVTIDTLRFDRLSHHGYPLETTPHLDALLAGGVDFSEARVVEPLTAPSMTSILTSLHPHEHGATRNGLRMRPGLPSMARALSQRGYVTGAFIGNWTLRDKLSGLAEHFDHYEEVVSRKRWFGMFNDEATAADLNEFALDWFEVQAEAERRFPVFLWVHYVEPHAPYRLHEDHARRMGIEGNTSSERYDTEVAFVDEATGSLLDGVWNASPREDVLVVFASDHGESLGEHSYWGHGRHLYESNLKVPMGLYWPGQLAPQRIETSASSLDLAPTLLGLVGLPVPNAFRGFDWSPVLRGEATPPTERTTYHQAHKGAVQSQSRSEAARRKGLLEVARVSSGSKEVWSEKSSERRAFDLGRDPTELRNLANGAPVSSDLEEWLARVHAGLQASDELPPPSLDPEDLEQLRALGYID